MLGIIIATSPTPLLTIAGRLLVAIAAGAIVGWERQAEHKPAGLRTHMLVSLGAALFISISGLLSADSVDSDAITRVMQGIIAGIGFLGAGEIVARSDKATETLQIHGLTSAAAIWVSASLGIAAGLGLWPLSLLGATLAYFILWGVKKLE